MGIFAQLRPRSLPVKTPLSLFRVMIGISAWCFAIRQMRNGEATPASIEPVSFSLLSQGSHFSSRCRHPNRSPNLVVAVTDAEDGPPPQRGIKCTTGPGIGTSCRSSPSSHITDGRHPRARSLTATGKPCFCAGVVREALFRPVFRSEH